MSTNLAKQTMPLRLLRKTANNRLLKRGRGQPQEKVVASKKARPVTESSSSVVASSFGEMARKTFTVEEVRVKADAHLKRAMRVVFYHGLSHLDAKDVRIKHLEQSLDKAIAQEASHHEELVIVQTKASDEVMAHHKQLGLL